MIDAQELIDYIKETGNLGVDATRISMHFGIWRNDAVVLLDSLIAEGRLTKKGSKPILYFLPSTYSVSTDSLSTEEDKVPFSNMIGYNGSLAMQTQMALAASSYPPNGIHTFVQIRWGIHPGHLWLRKVLYVMLKALNFFEHCLFEQTFNHIVVHSVNTFLTVNTT